MFTLCQNRVNILRGNGGNDDDVDDDDDGGGGGAVFCQTGYALGCCFGHRLFRLIPIEHCLAV